MRGMNGSSGASPDNRGYPPTSGIPGIVPPSPMSLGLGPGGAAAPNMGQLHGAAAAAAAGLGGPELKHHADFLSRLLAATPSYMSEMGNPPPGFFSDWLRRLVSKPSGNNGSQSSGLTFPGGGGQPEGESRGATGASSGGTNPSSIEAQQLSSKRRKRSRLNDHSEHPLGGASTGNEESLQQQQQQQQQRRPSPSGGSTTTNYQQQPHPPNGNINMNTGGSPPVSSAQAAAAAAASFPNLGAYPFWFFPPFLPNPYGLGGMNMGMNFPHHPSNSPSAAAAAAQAAAISSYLGSGGGSSGGPSSSSDLFRTDNLNLLSGSITSPVGGGGRTHTHPTGLPPHHPQFHPHHPLDPGSNPHLVSHLTKLGSGGGGGGGGGSSRLNDKGKDSLSPPVPRSPSSHKEPSYLAAAAAAASASFLLGGNGGSAAQQKHNNQPLVSPSYGSSPSANNNHNGSLHHHTKMSKSPSQKAHNAKSSSFSISRLTSPSPSSNSSGGSCASSKYHRGRRPSSTATTNTNYDELKPQHYNKSSEEGSVLKTNLNAGSKLSKDGNDAGLCVDLRVSGRIWESSGIVAPTRSMYTPLSAFRDPSDLYSGPQPHPPHHPHHHPHQLPPPIPTSSPQTLLQKILPPAPPTSSSPYPPGSNHPQSGSLSTKYVLTKIQHIYHRIRPTPTPTPTTPPCGNGSSSSSTTTTGASPTNTKERRRSRSPINNNSPKPPSPSTTATSLNHHQNDNKAVSTGTATTKDACVEESSASSRMIVVMGEKEGTGPRPHSSSSSSILDDDDFKPEAQLKMPIKDDTLNLTLNNNKGEMIQQSGGRKDGAKKARAGEKRRKLKEKDGFGKRVVVGLEKRLEQPLSNPYAFVDNEEGHQVGGKLVKQKNKKVKKENNNEQVSPAVGGCGLLDDVGEGKSGGSSCSKNVKIAKVKLEKGEEEEGEEDDEEEGGFGYEDNESINVSCATTTSIPVETHPLQDEGKALEC